MLLFVFVVNETPRVALFLSNLRLKNVWWGLIYCSLAVLNGKERWLKVPDGAMRPTAPNIPRRTFLRNGFDNIVCGIHPRGLLQIEI